MDYVWDCLSVLSELLIFSDVNAEASTKIQVKVLASIGTLVRIPASIRIPVRIKKVNFGILVRIPASIRNPIRIAAKVRVLPEVRIL